MKNYVLSLSRKHVNTAIIDAMIFIVILLTPALTHLINLPLYYLEPMRLMLFVSLIYSNRNNSLFIAVALPFFSLLISGHPVFLKAVLISAEFSINVILFLYLSNLVKNNMLSISISLILSKLIYYFLKYILISAFLMKGVLITVPVTFQVGAIILTTLLFTGLLHLKSKK